MKIHSRSTNRLAGFLFSASILLSIVVSIYFTLQNKNANAISATDFKAGNIISDYVFYNKNTMNVHQIQDFLNRNIGSCDTWGSQRATDWGRGDITRAQFAKQRWGVDPPFVCLNHYHENPTTGETSYEKGGGWFQGGISAAQIIYDASQKYGINPQVLLVLLKKESSGPLTSDSWPLKNQYKYAMGYACPDSGPGNSANCNSEKGGFYKQVNLAAWQLNYYRTHPNDYRYGIGWNDIQYSPNAACGTKRVYIENIATLSLYIYTPYTPNDAALANYPGTAHCGAYGNRNFFMFFSEWFGSTTQGGSIDMTKAAKDIKAAYGSQKSVLGSPLTDLIAEFDQAPRVWQTYQNGTIIWTDQFGAHAIPYGDIYNRWKHLGGSVGIVGVPSGKTTTEVDDGRVWQSFRSGVIIYSAATGAWDVQNGPISAKWRSMGGSLGKLGKPTSGVAISGSMRKQNFEHGAIVRKNTSSPAYSIVDDIYKMWSDSVNQAHLSVPTGDQAIESSDGRVWQYFDGGLAIKSNSGTYFISLGAFHDAWKSSGGSSGIIGKPTSNPTKEVSRIWQTFERGIMIKKDSLQTAYFMQSGNILNKWRSLGGSTGELGVPISNEYSEKDGRSWQRFDNGYIISSESTGTWDIVGGFYKYWVSQGGSLGKLGKPTSSRVIKNDNTRWQTFERGKAIWSPTSGWRIEYNKS